MQIPDWTDPAAYPRPGTASLSEWSWEFLRRNETYQRDFAFVKEQMTHTKEEIWCIEGDLYQIAESDEPEPGQTIVPLPLALNEKYGLAAPMLFDPSLPYSAFSEIMPPIFSTSSAPPMIPYVEEIERVVPWRPADWNEVGVIFDLELPLEMQWQRIKRQLESRAAYLAKGEGEKGEAKIGLKRRKNSVNQYPDYLRVFDGRAAGAGNPEIAAVVFPEKSNEYPDYLGNHAVANALNAADDLIQWRYRDICLGDKWDK